MSILKEINLEYPLEGLMPKFQYFDHLMWGDVKVWEKTLMLEKMLMRAGGVGWQQRMRWLDGLLTQWT